MKYLFIAATAVLVLTGCHTNDRHQGSPGDDRYMENSNDRIHEGRVTDNVGDFGRNGSPTSPTLRGPGNGSGNF